MGEEPLESKIFRGLAVELFFKVLTAPALTTSLTGPGIDLGDGRFTERGGRVGGVMEVA